MKTIADFLHIRPVLTTKNDGNMGVAGIVKETTYMPNKMSKFVLGKMDPDKSYNVAIGHSNNFSDGEKLKELIERGHNNLNSIYLMDIGCALGVHAGPGSLAAAIQLV